MATGIAAGDEERESTRQRILDIALDLFTEQGYEKTSLREIAERLGFSKAAIYYHFASKEDILMALHMRLHEFGHDALVSVGAAGISTGQWQGLLDQLIDQVMAHRKLFVLHERNRAALEMLHREPHAASHEDIGNLFRTVLASPAIAPRDRVRMACSVGAVMGGLLLSEDLFSDIETAELAKFVREVAHDVLGPGGEAPGPG